MAARAPKPAPSEWASLLTESPRRNLRRAMRWSQNLDKLVKPTSPKMPKVRTKLVDPSGIVIDAGGQVHVYVTLEWRRAIENSKKHGEVFGSAQFELHQDEQICVFDNLRINGEDDQRGGIGREYLNTLIKLCRELDVTLITLVAQDAGRYVWAREGFDFADPIWRDNVVYAAKEFAARLGIKVPRNLDTVKHPSDIANLYGAVSLEVAAEVRGDPLSSRRDEIMTLGEALLLGPRGNEWEGILDLEAEPFQPTLAV